MYMYMGINEDRYVRVCVNKAGVGQLVSSPDSFSAPADPLGPQPSADESGLAPEQGTVWKLLAFLA